jgi:hypothetical protein
VSEPRTPAADQRFELSAPPPVRALAISAIAALLAISLLLADAVVGLPVGLVIVAVVLLVLGLALALTGVVLTRRLRTSVALTADSITVTSRRRRESVAWSDVHEVALRGSRLVLVNETGAAHTSVVNPRPPGDPTFMSLVVALQDRLNRSRGYGERPFEGPV